MFGDEAEQETERKPAWKRIGVPAAVLMFVGGGAYGIMTLLHVKGPAMTPHREMPHIQTVLLQPPPPPPPPPKQEEKPKPEEKVVQKIQQPKPQAPKISAPKELTTSNAGPGNDAFGLHQGNGEGDVVGGGGDDADNSGYYESVVKSMVQDALRQDDRLRSAKYRGTISFVFDQYGHVQNVNFENFTGDDDARDAVVRALQRMAASEPIPADMENGKPWVVRINAHAPG